MDESVTIAFLGHAAAEHEGAAFAFEDEMLPLLADHGATLRYRGRRTGGQDPGLPFEVHLISFPARSAYEGYLTDERRRALIARHGEVFTNKVVVELDTIDDAPA